MRWIFLLLLLVPFVSAQSDEFFIEDFVVVYEGTPDSIPPVINLFVGGQQTSSGVLATRSYVRFNLNALTPPVEQAYLRFTVDIGRKGRRQVLGKRWRSVFYARTISTAGRTIVFFFH